jgi:L-threonylcarbamoyladenylate synthase
MNEAVAGDASSGVASPIVDFATIDAAAHRLARGLLVAFPTETVYGLGADAADPLAVAKIFVAKGRPSDHPLIVHVAPDADVLQWARELPPLAVKLIERFWPGPLTLILPRRAGVGAAAAGGQDAIGLRCPSHPVAQRLLRRYAELKQGAIGIAAPSANRFGRVSPTRASHVLDEFAGASMTDIDAAVFVIDGGDCDVGIESTIVDCSRMDSVGPVLLRPGSVTAAMLADVIGALPAAHDEEAPRASGTLTSHYAPATPVRLVDATMLIDAPDDVVAWTWSMPDPQGRADWRRAPTDAADYAHDLYAVLRDLDRCGARAIWIERPPASAEWAGVHDRLTRAAAGLADDGFDR